MEFKLKNIKCKNWKELKLQGRKCFDRLIVLVVLNYRANDSSFDLGQWFFYGESSNESSSDEPFDTIENLSSYESSDIFGIDSNKEWKPHS